MAADASVQDTLLRARQTDNGSFELTALGYGVSVGRETGIIGGELRQTFDWSSLSSWFGGGQRDKAPWWSCTAPRKQRPTSMEAAVAPPASGSL